MTTAAVIVAAGRGTRAGGGIPKQWRALAGQSVLARTVSAFRGVEGVSTIMLVLHPEDMDRAKPLLGNGVLAVEGGSTRADSVRNALTALENTGVDQVLIHDGARPLVSPALIARLLAVLADAPAAAPALPVTDALWRGAGGAVCGTVARDGLYRAQTPQGFRFAPILAAHRAHPGGAADDVEVARAAGIEVAIVAGDEHNLKLTYREDFDRAERYIGEQVHSEAAMDIRTGNGFDVHRFGPGDAVWLCGVQVPFERGLVGHSDADVAMHAVTDAIYGALAEGDIGQHFPPSEPQWKGAASSIFLQHAMGRVLARGYRLTHADVTMICERPKIGPHAPAMRAALAQIMGIGQDRVSVKATTSEQLGFTGREEGIAAMATVTLVQS